MPSAVASRRHRSLRVAVAAALLSAAAAPASDPAPEVVASFTRRVQPLLINRCGAGACHGGPESPAFRVQRGPVGVGPDRARTLANLESFLEAVGPDRDARSLAALLAAGHPSAAAGPRRIPPLSAAERLTLERWLADVRRVERLNEPADPGVVPAAAELPEPAAGPAAPNRFRALLDAAAHPPVLPPPQPPQGVIFKNDVPPAE